MATEHVTNEPAIVQDIRAFLRKYEWDSTLTAVTVSGIPDKFYAQGQHSNTALEDFVASHGPQVEREGS